MLERFRNAGIRPEEIEVKMFDGGNVIHLVTGHFKTSQSGSNQNQPFRGALFISVLLSHARGFTVSSNLLHFSWR
jgi:hypothetical protein